MILIAQLRDHDPRRDREGDLVSLRPRTGPLPRADFVAEAMFYCS